MTRKSEEWAKFAATRVREDSLLSRGVRQMDSTAAVDFLRGKTVMVTGAGGSIGSELVQAVRADPALASNRVYLFTAEVEMKDAYAERGFDGILLKPASLEAVKGLLSRHGLRHQTT